MSKKKNNVKSKSDHRKAAQLYVNSDGGHWVRRIIREMKDNPTVQKRLLAGEFDWALDPANNPIPAQRRAK